MIAIGTFGAEQAIGAALVLFVVVIFAVGAAITWRER